MGLKKDYRENHYEFYELEESQIGLLKTVIKKAGCQGSNDQDPLMKPRANMNQYFLTVENYEELLQYIGTNTDD